MSKNIALTVEVNEKLHTFVKDTETVGRLCRGGFPNTYYIMDRNLSALEPALVWKHFAEIARIPRPSHHEAAIRKYIVDFADRKSVV